MSQIVTIVLMKDTEDLRMPESPDTDADACVS